MNGGDFFLVVVVVILLTITNFLAYTNGFEKGTKSAIADICETRKVVCKVPDVEIKLP